VASRNPLGRGLNALLQDADLNTAAELRPNGAPLPDGIEQRENGALFVALDLLKPNPKQPRSDFDDEALAELAESIKENGVIQPVVIEVGDDGNFYIIAGERRTRAARLAGLEKVPVTLKSISEDKRLEMALIENIQRENLNPIEEAQAYNQLMESGSLSQDDVAWRVGKKRSTGANALRLLKLPDDMQSALMTGKITAGHARSILAVDDPKEQRIFFARLLATGMSVRDAEQYVADLNSPDRRADTNSKKAAPDSGTGPVRRDPNLVSMEQRLIEFLGTKVSLKGTFDRGSVTIEYFTAAELDRLYVLLGGLGG
jgi:ParB family chromosome partitioning protein